MQVINGSNSIRAGQATDHAIMITIKELYHILQLQTTPRKVM